MIQEACKIESNNFLALKWTMDDYAQCLLVTEARGRGKGIIEREMITVIQGERMWRGTEGMGDFLLKQKVKRRARGNMEGRITLMWTTERYMNANTEVPSPPTCFRYAAAISNFRPWQRWKFSQYGFPPRSLKERKVILARGLGTATLAFQSSVTSALISTVL